MHAEQALARVRCCSGMRMGAARAACCARVGERTFAPAAQAGSKACSDGGAPAREEKRGALRLRAGLNDTALAAALAPFSKRKVLVFDDIRAAFAGFADPADAAKCAPALALPRVLQHL